MSDLMNENRKGKIKYFLAGAAVALTAAFLILLLIYLAPYHSYVEDPTGLNAGKKTKEIVSYIDQYFLGETDKKNMADYMYLGLVSGLEDPYSTYFTKEEYDDVSMNQHGDYRGIGITVSNRTEDGALIVTKVTENGPSERVGILTGDLILKINGEDFAKADPSEVVAYIRGLDADSVELTVYRENTGEELTFEIPMETLEDYSVKYKMMDDGIGYVYISSFTARTFEQFEEARTDLESQGMKALIVDLRGDLGGLVSAVKDVLNGFMPEGLIFYTEDKYGNRNEYFSKGEHVWDVPMAVLVNNRTASASEIFAGAVQDHEVATIIGEVTYGKGIVQNAYKLSDGSVLRITVSHYYTPNGNDIHKAGITPDILIENEDGKDTQYQRAVEILKKQLNE